MTHEQFKDICLKEFPLIEGMVKKVKALGANHVTCTVYANGTLNFQIHEHDMFSIVPEFDGEEQGDVED